MIRVSTDVEGIAPLDRSTDRPDTQRQLDRFLAAVEHRAFHIARIAVRSDDEALDIVQEAMLGLVRRYGNRPAAQWRPLFFRILESRITDWHRRRKVRNRWRLWPDKAIGDDEGDGIEQLPDPRGSQPWQQLHRQNGISRLSRALERLPLRQQQAFLLRAWEGLSVADTAAAMGCSTGSVKTHYSRATHSLRHILEDYSP